MQNESLNALTAPSPSLVSNSRGPLLVPYPLRPEKHRHTARPGAPRQPAQAGASQGAVLNAASAPRSAPRAGGPTGPGKTHLPCPPSPRVPEKGDERPG